MNSMIDSFRNLIQSEDAVTVGEYAIIISLITLTIVSAFDTFKSRVEVLYTRGTTVLPS